MVFLPFFTYFLSVFCVYSCIILFITKNVSFYKKRIPAFLILLIVGLEVLW